VTDYNDPTALDELIEHDFDYDDATSRVELSDIAPNPWNPHRMTGEEIKALIESIREDGQWRPILVVEMDEPDELDPEILARYRIVDGEHAYHALCALTLEGAHDGTARVMVLGKNSAIPVWKQQLWGQTINHGLRGSQEDAELTRQVFARIMRHRSPEHIAKRVGLGEGAVAHLAGTRLPSAPARPAGVLPVQPSGLAAGVQGAEYQERKAYVTALSFPDATTQARFDALMGDVGEIVALDPDAYQGRRGQFRVDALMLALEKFVKDAGLA
jgi:hypothetical protein